MFQAACRGERLRIMESDSKALLTPVIQLFLLAVGQRFAGPDKNFLSGEKFRAR